MPCTIVTVDLFEFLSLPRTKKQVMERFEAEEEFVDHCLQSDRRMGFVSYDRGLAGWCLTPKGEAELARQRVRVA